MLSALAAGAALVALGPFQAPLDESSPPPAAEELLRQELVQLARARMDEHRVPGMALVLLRGGEVAWCEGLGFADVEDGRPVTADTVFNVGATSQLVAALGLARLVERGEFQLDEPVLPHLERWQLPETKFDPHGVTLERLLSHTAGLSVDRLALYPPGASVPRVEVELGEPTDSSEPVRLVHEPGTRSDFSAGGYLVAQLLLEEVTGEDFAAWMRREVLEPLGMTHSDFRWTEDVSARAATFYDRRGRAHAGQRFAGVAAAGLQTTATDLARFALACLPDQRSAADAEVLSTAGLLRMQQPVPPAKRGLGFELAERGGLHLVGHGATGPAAGGWVSVLDLVPATGDGLVLLCNGANGDRYLEELESAWLRFQERESSASPAARRVAVYRLRLDAETPRLVHVEAELPLVNRRLALGRSHAFPEEAAWSDYVDELELRNLAGERLAWSLVRENLFVLDEKAPERIRAEYDVRIEHDELTWPAGLAEACYAQGDSAYWRMWAVLLEPAELEGARVELELPEGWVVSTSLAPVLGDELAFTAATAQEFLGGAMMVGRLQVQRILASGVSIELAATPELPGAAEAMSGPLGAAVRATVQMFGDAPGGRFTVLAGRDPNPNASGGSGFPGGMAVRLGKNPADDRGGGWAHTLIHEVIHLWNGVAIPAGDSSENAWFTEGFTDYLALVIAGRQDLVRDEWRLAYMGRMWDGYAAASGELAPSKADARDHYDLVYGGGLFFALLLDLELRSQGESLRIDDFMRAVYEEFGRRDEPYDSRDLERIAEEVAGRDLGRLFRRHVRGKHRIDPRDFLVPLGLSMQKAGDARNPHTQLVLDPDPTNTVRRLRHAVLGME